MKKLLAFSFYDVGNSVFPMIVVSALTSSYFVNQVVDDPQTGTAFCLLYTSPSPRDGLLSRMPSSA